MGNKPLINLSFQDSSPAFPLTAVLTFDNRRIWKHPFTHEEMEQIPLKIPNATSLESQLECFKLRLNSPLLVKTVHFQKEEHTSLCSKGFAGRLFLENIVLRLSQIDEIPFPDVLHLLSQALRGFSLLRNRYGPFLFDEKCVAINRQAKVKVWCNQQFEKTTPECVYSINKITESDMVQRVLGMAYQNANKSMISGDLMRSLGDRQGNLEFSSVIARLDEYTKRKGLIVPKCLESVSTLLSKVGRADPFEVLRISGSTTPHLPMSRQCKQPLSPENTTQEKVNGVVSQHHKNMVSFIPDPQGIDSNRNKQPVVHTTSRIVRQQPDSNKHSRGLNQQHMRDDLTVTPRWCGAIRTNIPQNIQKQVQEPDHQINSHYGTLFRPILLKTQPVHSRHHSRISGVGKVLDSLQQSSPTKHLDSRQAKHSRTNTTTTLEYNKKVSFQNSHDFMSLGNGYVDTPCKQKQNQSGILPTGASFQQNASYNNANVTHVSRFLTSPSMDNLESSLGIERPQRDDTFNATTSKKKLAETDIKVISLESQRHQQSISIKIRSPPVSRTSEERQRSESPPAPLTSMSPACGLSIGASEYVKNQGTRTDVKPRKEGQLIECKPQMQDVNMLCRSQQNPPQMSASMQSISFKKDGRVGNSFSFDEFASLLDQPRGGLGDSSFEVREFQRFDREFHQELEQHFQRDNDLFQQPPFRQFLQPQGQNLHRTRPERPSSAKAKQVRLKNGLSKKQPLNEIVTPEQPSIQGRAQWGEVDVALAQDIVLSVREDPIPSYSLPSFG